MIANNVVAEENGQICMMIILASFQQQWYLCCPSETTIGELLVRLAIYR